MRKFISVLLITSMLVALAGCGSKGEGGKSAGTLNVENGEGEKGRYVEKEIAFPDGVSDADVFQIGKKKGAMCLYAVEEKEEGLGIVCYRYQDGSFVKDTPAWMEGLLIGEENFYNARILEDIGGRSYFLAITAEEEGIQAHLYCTSDGTSVEEITPQDWLEMDSEWHFFETPEDIAVLEDGSIAANFISEVKFYDTERKLVRTMPLSIGYGDWIYADKNFFYLEKQNEMMEFKGIAAFAPDKDSPVKEIACAENIGRESRIDILSDGSFIVCARGGFFKCSAEGEWSTLVAGSYTSLALENMWCGGMTALDSGELYVFLSDETEQHLMEYTYDAEMPLKPQTVLTVYSVYDNATLKQAAVMYTKLHPEVLVEVETGISYDEMETADLNTVLQNLNVRLLAGEGADIMVLDALNVNSLIEKGMLADISDVVTPMSESGEILKNIVDGYTQADGAVYMVPLRYSMRLLLSGQIDTKASGSVEGLAAALEQQELTLGPATVMDLVDIYMPYMVSDIVKDKKLDKEALAKCLEALKIIAGGYRIVDNYSENTISYQAWDLPLDASAVFCDVEGFLSAMLPVAIVNEVKGNFNSFENAYTPIGEIGINKETPYLEQAKDFLRYALSVEVQEGDFYDGFPINAEALNRLAEKDRSDYEVYTMIEMPGGEMKDFIIGAMDKEDCERLTELCKGLNKKVINDTQIMLVISDVLPSYLDGSSSPEETIDKIERGLSMYLAE
ncbi:MAG: extracellular solute-binding protein [Lachnospiraceae bacterium]|nr:extracellular solute-binding protein [Lachnospiraceae bacterium]